MRTKIADEVYLPQGNGRKLEQFSQTAGLAMNNFKRSPSSLILFQSRRKINIAQCRVWMPFTVVFFNISSLIIGPFFMDWRSFWPFLRSFLTMFFSAKAVVLQEFFVFSMRKVGFFWMKKNSALGFGKSDIFMGGKMQSNGEYMWPFFLLSSLLLAWLDVMFVAKRNCGPTRKSKGIFFFENGKSLPCILGGFQSQTEVTNRGNIQN